MMEHSATNLSSPSPVNCKQLEIALEAIREAVVWADQEGQIEWSNASFERLVQRSDLSIQATRLVELLPLMRQSQPISPAEHPIALALNRDRGTGIYEFRRDNQVRVLEIAWDYPPTNGDGAAFLTIGDITEQQKLRHDILHNPLTNLPNRSLFRDRLAHAAQLAERHASHFAVLLLDLDRFKVINDSLGPRLGDQLLITMARRLEACLRPADTVAHLGGDEFAILLEDIGGQADAIAVAEQLQHAVAQPCYLEGHEVCSTSSVGIVFSTPMENQPDDLLRNADIAMYRAKAEGRNRYQIFERNMHRHAVTLLQLESDMRRAIERSEFLLHYQPIVSLASKRLLGLEALLRWNHPEYGLISPEGFIPVAEDTGLIVPIGSWVLREACRQMQDWLTRLPHDLSEQPLSVSVNLSARQFAQPDLLEQIEAILAETQLEARHLKLEITESVIMGNAEAAAVMLEKLKARGIRISIDDFGTGYSSLSYLYRLPIDTLKIDRSFINSVDVDGEKLELVRAIASLAWNIGMDIVAEGVETSKQLAQLRALRCESGQGYLFSRPLDARAAEVLIREGLT